ncbi:hypothetical protein Tco_1018208 [Tanacetum coccineum]|uniref:CCHC-type domain-containing protein n=1 Tax=Tanacetum coccineum TaxID=301880 RepID=A0ABQ5FV55_9ASTR
MNSTNSRHPPPPSSSKNSNPTNNVIQYQPSQAAIPQKENMIWLMKNGALINGPYRLSKSGRSQVSLIMRTKPGVDKGVDWTHHSEDEDYALMACNSSDSDTEVISCSNKCKESYVNLKKLYDAQREQLSDASIEIKAYSQEFDVEIDDSKFTYGPKQTQPSESESQSSEFDTCESNISAEPSELVSEPVVNESNVECQPKVWSDAPIIEEETVKNQYTHSQKPKVDKTELGYGFTVRACFVCGSLNHLIRDCDFHEKRMARKAELNNVNTARTSGTKNFSTARQSVNRQTVLTSTAMKVNTVKPIVNRGMSKDSKQDRISKKHRIAQRGPVSKQWRKVAKGGSSLEMVDEDKEIDEIRLSTEDVLSTDKSTLSTEEHIEGTEEQIESTDGQRKGNFKHSELKTKKFEEIQALYEKIKRSDEDFISIGSAEDERLIKRMNEKGIDSSKSEVIKEESKEEVQEESKEEESTRKRKLGTRKKMKSRKRRFIQNTSEDDSEKENDELRLHLTIAPDEEKEVDYEILDRKYPIKEWKTECLGTKPQADKAEHFEEINQNVVIRSNGQKRYFSTLMRVLSIFDREDLNAVYQLVMDRYQDEIPEGFDRVLWGDLMVMFNPDDENEFWNSQQDWNIVSWKLHGSSGVHTLVTEDEE